MADNTVLLIHSDAIDGSTVFTDSSNSAHPLIATGAIKHSTTEHYFGTSSIYFDGNASYLSLSSDSDFDLSQGDCTLDCWVYLTGLSADEQDIIQKDGVAGSSYAQYLLGIDPSGKLIGFLGNGNGISPTGTHYTGSTVLSLNTWHHVCLIKYDSTCLGFLDGIQEWSGSIPAMYDGGKDLYIGQQQGQPNLFTGYIDEIRILKGEAAWTANFTPPTAPYSLVQGIQITSPEIIFNAQAQSFLTIQMKLLQSISLNLQSALSSVFTGLFISSPEIAFNSFVSESGISLSIKQPDIVFQVQEQSSLSIQLKLLQSIVLNLQSALSSVFIGKHIISPEIVFNSEVSSTLTFSLYVPIVNFNSEVTSFVSFLIQTPAVNFHTSIETGNVDVFTIQNENIVYLFTLTGTADGLPDIEIPISSFQARLLSGSPTYLSAVIPGYDYTDDINARPNGSLKVDVAYITALGTYALRQTIIVVDLEDIRLDIGPGKSSITLTGHKQSTYTAKAVTLKDPIYKNMTNGKFQFRFARPNVFINPGDTVIVNSDTITANVISYYVRAGAINIMTQMEISEE